MAVVVGYAGNDEGRAALARGVVEAAGRRTGLVVVDTGREATPPEQLAAVAAEAAGSSGVEVVLAAPAGVRDAAEEVITAAEGAELVVIGLRRRTNVGKLILGANATRILLEASCPVLTVKPDQP